MALVDNIPLPKTGMQAFDDSLLNSQSVFNSLINNQKVAAEGRRADAMAKLPFGGANVPGPAGQIVGLEMIKQQYGENSPQYKAALGAFNLAQNSTNSRISYQDALTHSLPIRYTTNEGRQQIERSNVNQGYSPAGTPQGTPIAPGQAPFYAQGYNPDDVVNQVPSQNQPGDMNAPANNVAVNQYDQRMLKQNVPAQVLNKDLYATNIETTLNDIDKKALSAFNNPLGQLRLKWEQSQDALGRTTSQEYKDYVKAVGKFNLLPNQVRQFYGSSVQPSQVEELQNHLDPRMTFGSQNTGLTKYDAAADLLKKELKTYRNATQGTAVYTGQNQNQSNQSNLPPAAAHSQVRTKHGEPGIILYKGQTQYVFPARFANSPKLRGYTLEPS